MLLTLLAPQGSGSVDLTAVGITAGVPTLGTPALGQVHALVAVGITAGAPVLDAPQLNPPAQADVPAAGVYPRIVRRVVALRAIGITAGVPTLGTPALSVRPSEAQIAAMIAEQNRAALWADDEEAIAALLLAA